MNPAKISTRTVPVHLHNVLDIEKELTLLIGQTCHMLYTDDPYIRNIVIAKDIIFVTF